MKKKRETNRFKEKRKDLSRLCVVTFTQQFHPHKTYHGKLYDLSENAVKVLVDNEFEEELLSYKPQPTLLKFRFSQTYKITISVSRLTRIDSEIIHTEDKIGVVLHFDFISDEDKKTIKEIIGLYG